MCSHAFEGTALHALALEAPTEVQAPTTGRGGGGAFCVKEPGLSEGVFEEQHGMWRACASPSCSVEFSKEVVLS